MSKKILLSFLLIASISSHAQLGGGTLFSNAVTFNQGWLTGCPAGGTTFSNTTANEPTTAMDPCAPAPACATGTTIASDVWFSFSATSATATIVVDPSTAFDVAIQAFSGSACPGLTDIGCVDAAGNNQPETLALTGLTSGTLYYFRIFGANNNVNSSTGTYNFCGSAGLGDFVLPVTFVDVKLTGMGSIYTVSWEVADEINVRDYVVERSSNGQDFTDIATVPYNNNGGGMQTYRYADAAIAGNTSVVYYRIRQTDIDGKFMYSKVVSFRTAGNKTSLIVLSGNPVTGSEVVLNISAERSGTVTLQLIDVKGRVLISRKQTISTGDNTVRLSSGSGAFANGTYFLHAVINGQKFVEKINIAR